MDIDGYYIADNNSLRANYTKRMKDRLILWLCNYSYRITAYAFWIIFLYVLVLDVFNGHRSITISYLFWLLLGIYLGYSLALRVTKYLRMKRK